MYGERERERESCCRRCRLPFVAAGSCDACCWWFAGTVVVLSVVPLCCCRRCRRPFVAQGSGVVVAYDSMLWHWESDDQPPVNLGWQRPNVPEGALGRESTNDRERERERDISQRRPRPEAH